MRNQVLPLDSRLTPYDDGTFPAPFLAENLHDAVDLPDAETRLDRIRLGVQAFATVLEDIIREEPSQWHLFQPNWPSDAQLESEPK